MKENILLTNYKDLSLEELKKLPVEELAQALHGAIREWDKLNQKVNQDSTNSNRAPSTDSPEAKAKRKTEKEKEAEHQKHGARKQGAQPGHKATCRPLLPLSDGDIVIDCKPEICAHCRASLAEESDSEPYRQQYYDFEVTRRTTEYRKHKIKCGVCGHTSEGKLPEEANKSTYGPNIAGLVGTLTGQNQMSRRMTATFIEEFTGIPISEGSISNLEKELTEAAQPVMNEIEFAAQNATQGNVDETGMGMKNSQQGWLWVLATPFAVLFRLFAGRGQKYASLLLGCFDGILTSDRWCGYNQYPKEKHQLCWAHLLRDYKSMTEQGRDGEAIGKALRKEARAMFRLWHRFKKWKNNQESKGIKVSMTVLESQMSAIRKKIKTLLEEGKKRGVPKCGSILKLESQLWVFTKEEGIEPTNNVAERSIRPAVLWKKRSFGVESERGARYMEAMLSIKMTARLNGVRPAEFLRELIHSSRSKTPVPSIFSLPSPERA